MNPLPDLDDGHLSSWIAARASRALASARTPSREYVAVKTDTLTVIEEAPAGAGVHYPAPARGHSGQALLFSIVGGLCAAALAVLALAIW